MKYDKSKIEKQEQEISDFEITDEMAKQYNKDMAILAAGGTIPESIEEWEDEFMDFSCVDDPNQIVEFPEDKEEEEEH